MKCLVGAVGLAGLFGLSGCAVIPPIQCGENQTVKAPIIVQMNPPSISLVAKIETERKCPNENGP